MISDIFQFSEDIRNIPVDADHILVSYDVTALFTNVPAHETIGILAEKAFAGNWFNNVFTGRMQPKTARDRAQRRSEGEVNFISQSRVLNSDKGSRDRYKSLPGARHFAIAREPTEPGI